MASTANKTENHENEVDEVEKEEPAKEEIFLFEFEKNKCDVVFVFDGKTNKTLHCPSSFLNRISKEFQNNMVKTDDGSHFEIKAEGFSVEALTKALSFYQPKYFEYFKDSDDFRGLLTACCKYGLVALKKKIQDYLIEEHALITNQQVISKSHFYLLQIAVDFGFDVLYDTIMSKKGGFSFNEEIASSMIFMDDKWKYEIIKKCIKNDITSSESSHKDMVALEVISIFHFLDYFFQTNKTLDCAIHPNVESPPPKISENIQRDFSNFFIKNEVNNVCVKVEDRELFINSTILSGNAPVFKAMLNSTFKEGLENVIALPGKRVEDIIDLFAALTEGKKTADYNAFSLFPLCREYQIDWLQDLIQEQLMNRLELSSDRLRLKYANLSQDMGFLRGEEKFVNSLCESFIQLQRYQEFNDLTDETKILVALRRLWYVYIYCCLQKNPSSSNSNGPLAYLFHDKMGLPSIFKNVQKVRFWLNQTEDKIISSLKSIDQINYTCASCNASRTQKATPSTGFLFGSTSTTVASTFSGFSGNYSQQASLPVSKEKVKDSSNKPPFLIVSQDW